MKSKIVFADIKVKEAFEKLKDSRTEDKQLYQWLLRALMTWNRMLFAAFKFLKS